MLTLTLKNKASALLTSEDGDYIGKVTVVKNKRSQVTLQFELRDDVEVARDALICDCDHVDHEHPIWWCRPDLCNQGG